MKYFTYYDDNGNAHSYEVSDQEAKEYIERVRDADEIISDYEDLYNANDWEDWINKTAYDGTFDSFFDMNEDDKKEAAKYMLDDLIETDYYDDELEDYFEDQWREDMQDAEYERQMRRASYNW